MKAVAHNGARRILGAPALCVADRAFSQALKIKRILNLARNLLHRGNAANNPDLLRSNTMKALSPGILLLLLASTASADFSANLGFASDYYYRGIFQIEIVRQWRCGFRVGRFLRGRLGRRRRWRHCGDGSRSTATSATAAMLVRSVSASALPATTTRAISTTPTRKSTWAPAIGLLSLDVGYRRVRQLRRPALGLQFYSADVAQNGFYGPVRGLSQDISRAITSSSVTCTLVDIDSRRSPVLPTITLVGDEEQSLIFTIGKSFDL